MANPWTFTINTGNPTTDQQELARCQQAYQAQGMTVQAQALPSGGFQVTVSPAHQATHAAHPSAAQPGANLGGTMIMSAQGAPAGTHDAYGAPQTAPAAQFGAAQQQYGEYGQQQYGQQPYAQPQAQQATGGQTPYGAQQYGAQQQYQAQASQPQQAYQGAPGYAQASSPGAPNYGAGQYAAPPAGVAQYAAAAAAAGAYGAASPSGYGSAASGSGAQASPAGGYGGGVPAYAMAGGGSMAAAPAAGEGAINRAAEAVGAPPISSERLRYLRKVYGLLGISAFLAVFAGWASVSLGPTVDMISPDGLPAQVPLLVSIMLANEVVMYAAFGLLFVATIGASWVSKIPIINVAALMGVSVLMGIELAPMVFVAQFYAGVGDTMSSAPVRDAMIMVMSVFVGITGYVFVTRKDFSWMGSILSMGFLVVFAGCILTFVFDSEPFALAVASVGALFAIGMLLYVTSYIFRNSKMDDAVGDALALLVQLRNLFMFLLRIFMSRR